MDEKHTPDRLEASESIRKHEKTEKKHETTRTLQDFIKKYEIS